MRPPYLWEFLHLERWLSWWCHQMETFSALLAICAGIYQSPVNFPHKGQWRGALIFSLICSWIQCGWGKQWWGWWFDTPSLPLWRHYNVILKHGRINHTVFWWLFRLVLGVVSTPLLHVGQLGSLFTSSRISYQGEQPRENNSGNGYIGMWR